MHNTEILSQLTSISARLANACQTLAREADGQGDGELAADDRYAMGHELVALAGELTTLGANMAISRHVTSSDENHSGERD